MRREDEFTKLIQQHERLIGKIATAYTATPEDRQDLFQDIVLQAWRAWPQFKAAAQFSTWLFRIGLNTALSRQRKKTIASVSLSPDLAAYNTHSEAPTATEDPYHILQQMIGALPPLERALVLLYLEDYSYTEISGIMGISVSNVGTRLGRIREKLGKQHKSLNNS